MPEHSFNPVQADALQHLAPIAFLRSSRHSFFGPDASVLQPEKQCWHPTIGTLANGSASDSHRTINLSVFRQLAEEDRHRALCRLHRDFALHRDDGRNAGFRQKRTQSSARSGSSVGRRTVPAGSALARSQNDQPWWILQLAYSLRQITGRDWCGLAQLVLQVEARKLLFRQRSVTNQVDNIAAFP